MSVVNVPNLLTGLRLAFVPILFWLAWDGRSRLYLFCLGFSLCTDVLDGFAARRLNQTSAFGAKLDSWADLATTLSLPICVWWLWPQVVRSEAPFVIAAVGTYAAAVAVGFVKYHRLTSYHTWLGKVAAVLMGTTTLVLLAGGPAWPFEWTTPILVLAGLEEIGMTIILPAWEANVPSLWHALRLRARSRIALCGQDASRR